MPNRIGLIIHRTHDQEPRERKTCYTCERRIMCTRETVSFVVGGKQWDIWSCNACLTEPWRPDV